MVKNILITGSHGQLGNELQTLVPLFPEFAFFQADIDTLDLCDPEAVRSYLNDHQIDYVVNCAAYTAVDRAEDEPELCFKVNRDAVRNLAEAAANKVRIIHISTDYVFDGRSDRSMKETDPVGPRSVYGKSKLAGEQILTEISPQSIIIRTAWLYSAFGNNFVKTMIRLGKERDSLNVVNDQVGTPTNAADLARAILDIIRYSEEKGLFVPGIYHYSNEGICSWYDFTLRIHQLAAISCQVNPVPTEAYPTKAVRPGYSVLDKTKIKETFGIFIPDWEESLKNYMDRNRSLYE